MKTKFIYLIIFILALSSCGKSKDEEEEKKINRVNDVTNIETQVETDDDEEDDINLYEGFKNGTLGNIVCKSHFEQDNGIVDQIFYISGIKMRLEMTSTFEGKKFTSYMVSDTEYTYTWGNGGAFKTKIEEEKEVMEEADEELEDGDDMIETLKNMPYTKCEKWDVDEDKFKIPDGIDFKDVTEGFDDLEGMKEIMNSQENTEQMPLPEDIQKIADQYNIQ